MFAASKTASVSGGYQIQRSLRFNSADSAYLNRTLTTPTDNKKFTLSMWVKKTSNGGDNWIVSVNASTGILFRDDTILYVNASGNATTSAVFRDNSAWYHLVFVFDSANATANDRMIIYVNNVRQALGTNTTPSLNATGSMNSAVPHWIGTYTASSAYLNGYMTEVNFIDGQALTPSSFGETNAQTGVWQPKAYSGSYGTNGFYLNFSDNSNTTAATLGKDYSGNGNNWTPNNFSVTAGSGNDSLVDSPTSYGTDTGVGGEVRGNYCTMNPLDKGAGVTLTNGNLNYAVSNGAVDSVRGTIGVASGKWYWECQTTGTDQEVFGIANASASTNTYVGGDANGWGFGTSGNKYNNNTATSYGSSCTSSDVVGVAFDADAGSLVFYKNGSSLGTAFSGLTTGVTYFPAGGSNNSSGVINFGQRPFAYTAPSGYKALCTQNLPTPTVGATTATQAGKYFNPVLYTGTGASLSVTGVGFQPDLVWGKSRSAATNNNLYDAVRGTGKILVSNNTDAEVDVGSLGLSAFNSDGFSLGAGSTLNNSGSTYVAWNWKANGSGSTNTAGSITSTVSANTTSGFSIATFTSQASGTATVGHGLGVAPSMVIVKGRNVAYEWYTYHVSLGASAYVSLSNLAASASSTTLWNATSPTSSVFSLGTAWTGSNTFVAYCFAEVAGYSKFGSYTGNGSTDGPFVYCGFRPAYVMFKRTDVANDWVINDATRSAYNQTINVLYANDSAAENTTGAGNSIDILSNGFKLRQTNNGSNASGGTYIFMAFASAPQKFALAR